MICQTVCQSNEIPRDCAKEFLRSVSVRDIAIKEKRRAKKPVIVAILRNGMRNRGFSSTCNVRQPEYFGCLRFVCRVYPFRYVIDEKFPGPDQANEIRVPRSPFSVGKRIKNSFCCPNFPAVETEEQLVIER